MEGDIRVSGFVRPVGGAPPSGRRAVGRQLSADGSVAVLESALPCCLFQDPFPRRPETCLRAFVSLASKVMRWKMVALPSGRNSTPIANS